MVHHFGDREDPGTPCGQCDVCAPKDCTASSLRAARPEELELLGLILEGLRHMDGQGTGRVCKMFVGETPADRKKCDVLLGALVRGGLLRLSADSFEKEGQTIHFTRAFVTPAGRGEVNLSELKLPVESVGGSKSRERKGRAAGGRSRSASRTPAPSVPAAAGPLVDALKAWRLQEARRRRIPAFRILSDKTLSFLAVKRPKSEAELLGVHGIGPKIAETYGAKLIALCGGPS